MNNKKNQDKIEKTYLTLLESYGLQGWWPIVSHKGINPTKTGSIKGYHPGDYSYPRNNKHVFEICIGAILTQNTAWPNVEKALINLKNEKALSPDAIKSMRPNKLRKLIRPAGYFNQKANYIINFIDFFDSIDKTPSREDLLSIKGIGNETADSMLLYAFKKPSFVIDAYTKRMLIKLGLADEKTDYEDMKKIFESTLKKDLNTFQEYHALIVEHGKRYYSKKPYGINDPLLR